MVDAICQIASRADQVVRAGGDDRAAVELEVIGRDTGTFEQSITVNEVLLPIPPPKTEDALPVTYSRSASGFRR
jgi:hypothetical protein